MNIELIRHTFINAGKIRDHIEKPEALRTLSSLFLFSFIYVFIELKRKTVGNIIGKSDGMWNIAILIKTLNSILLLELRLINSMRSIEIKRRQEKLKIMRNEIKFSFKRYLRISLLFNIIFFWP